MTCLSMLPMVDRKPKSQYSSLTCLPEQQPHLGAAFKGCSPEQIGTSNNS